jgi:glycosyltransferase involved in cell wall biosynthesis
MSARVALVAGTTADDGPELLAARLRHLLGAGWDAWLFCKGETWQREPALREPDLRERVEIAADAKALSNPFGDRLRTLRPDIVHFHSGWSAAKGLANGQLAESKIVIGFRADGQDLGMPEALRSRASRLLFPERAALERAIERGFPAERAAVMHAPPVEPLPERERASRATGTLRIVSAGALTWQQGYEHSVHAVRLLLDMGVECSYRIVGDGGHVQAVAFARHQLGLGEHVQLISPNGSGELAAELRSADVFVDPAVADTTSPIGIASAQRYGVPLVATARSTPLPDEVGITVPRRDPQAIAAAVARLASDDALRERMGDAGWRAAHKWLPDHLKTLERLYEEVLTEEAR